MPPEPSAVGLRNTQSNAHGRKKSVPGRVVPAIPLILTNPKLKAPVKPLPKIVDDAPITDGQCAEKDEKQLNPTATKLASSVNGDVKFQATLGSSSHASHNGMSVSSSPAPDSQTNLQPMSGCVQLSEHAPTSEPMALSRPSDDEELHLKPADDLCLDKMDMRPIKAGLPPAFVPAAEQQSATSQACRNPSFQASHLHRQGNYSIAFGGPNSPASSPAPPSTGSAYTPPHFSDPPFTQSGHALQNSESHLHFAYPPPYGPPTGHWNSQHNFHPQSSPAPYFHTQANPAFRYAQMETGYANGHSLHSRSGSQTSSAGFAKESNRAVGHPQITKYENQGLKPTLIQDHDANGHQHSHQYAPPPIQMQHNIPSAIENTEALRAHVLSQFSNLTFSDCYIQVRDENTGEQRYIDGHKIILSRSPTLLDLINAHQSNTNTNSIFVSLKDPYLRLPTFFDCVQYLYGGTLTQLDQNRQLRQDGNGMPSSEERMAIAVQYVATSAWLRVPSIAFRAIEVAVSLLHWDTVSTALTFALDGGLSNFWLIEDGSDGKTPTSSSNQDLWTEIYSSPRYDPFSTQLLHRIMHFMVHMFPHNFYLDSSAPQLASCPRLPSAHVNHESRPSTSDPRLTKIRFGELSEEEHQQPMSKTIISSILLSLPFALLKNLSEHFDLSARLGPETVASIMRQVVAERETRRLKALKARPADKREGGVTGGKYQSLYWTEMVETSRQNHSGFRLARRRADVDTSQISNLASEQKN
ncbi:Hypothetical protein R9X50_00570200 [Acrodontium crateriforme]|uniref:BTB domain-containing protein n=1 Tax=Acrodontium crateriforme TaxID=150365 RepID=A0AAQ3R9B5_9PEZI|nr:Hypothetical protein R9X50_00570200 [Acrodontium crateriforme]